MKYCKYSDDSYTWFICMSNGGMSTGRAYIEKGNEKIIYLDSLGVSEGERKQGLGTAMQEFREELGRMHGCTHSMLWVKRKTWRRKWYERRGYRYSSGYDLKHVWLKKKL